MVYDYLAFVPQGIIGAFFDKHPKINGCLITNKNLFNVLALEKLILNVVNV